MIFASNFDSCFFPLYIVGENLISKLYTKRFFATAREHLHNRNYCISSNLSKAFSRKSCNCVLQYYKNFIEQRTIKCHWTTHDPEHDIWTRSLYCMYLIYIHLMSIYPNILISATNTRKSFCSSNRHRNNIFRICVFFSSRLSGWQA